MFYALATSTVISGRHQIKHCMTECSLDRQNSSLHANRQTGELISPRQTSHEHNNEDLSRLRQLSPGMRVNTRYTNSTKGTTTVLDCSQSIHKYIHNLLQALTDEHFVGSGFSEEGTDLKFCVHGLSMRIQFH